MQLSSARGVRPLDAVASSISSTDGDGAGGAFAIQMIRDLKFAPPAGELTHQ